MMKVVLPGLIDPHVHLRDPGQTEKEDFLTGTQAALAGGYTTILDMPNNKTPIITMQRLVEKIDRAKQQIVCDIGFHFGSLGDNLTLFPEVAPKVTGLKLYLNETTGNFLIDKEKLEQIFVSWKKATEKPILLHAEDDAVAFVIGLVQKLGNTVHFCHISTRDDLRQIMTAKEQNLPVTCGVTPHHLFLTEQDAKGLGPFGKMKPPLQSQQDVDFLWKHLPSIDIIESDHAPHTREEKRGEVAPYGVPGLQTTLPLLLTAVSEKRLTLNDLVRLCHTNPASIFHITQDEGTKVYVDMNETYEIQNEQMYSKCGWTPFDGWKAKGKVISTYIRGTQVFAEDKIVAKPGFGNIITT